MVHRTTDSTSRDETARLKIVESVVRAVIASGSVSSREALLALVERLRVAGRVQCSATWGAYVVQFVDASYAIGTADSTGRATVRPIICY